MHSIPKTPLDFKTAIISDTHLGKGAASAEFLLEFLTNVKCERLILAGDILEGWGLKKKRRKPLPEMHARCLDALNAFAASGVEVVYLRGNHDEDLAKTKYKLMRKAKGLLRTVNFTDHKGEHTAPITFGKSYVHVDVRGRRHLVLHGDAFDDYQKNHKKKKIAKLADIGYEQFVVLNNVFRKAVMGATGKSVSPASHVKNATKHVVGVIDNFERSVTSKSVTGKYDGIICGHIHHAEIRDIDGFSYMNSGDWVESCKCLAETYDGEWKILDWTKERKKLGIKTPPTVGDYNLFSEFRGITERQIKLIRRVWPGSDYQELIGERRERRAKIRERESLIAEIFDGASKGELRHHRNKIEKQERKLEDVMRRLEVV